MGNNRSSLISKTISINGARTSVRLEQAYWDALEIMCRERKITREEVIKEILQGDGTLTSRLRVRIIDFHRHRTTGKERDAR